MKDLLHGIYVYSKMLNNTNIKFQELIESNTEKDMQENEQLFYEVISDILRILPVKKAKNEIQGLDMKSGILLLSDDISFLQEDYRKIVNNEGYRKIICDLVDVRNKFIHEPHNIHAAFYVGGKTSCSMGLYYKETLCSVSTIKISYIVYELNKVFQKLKEFFLDKVNQFDDKYKEYPCYENIKEFDFEGYNKEYPMMPFWMLAEEQNICDEIDLI